MMNGSGGEAAAREGGSRRWLRPRVFVTVAALALVAIGVVLLVTQSGDVQNAQRASTTTLGTGGTTTESATQLPTTQAPITRVVTNDSAVRGFVSAANQALGQQPWSRCTNRTEGFSVGAPAGWHEPTPDPPDPGVWTSAGTTLAAYHCEFFGFAPFTICPQCQPMFATVTITASGPQPGSANAPGQPSPTYAEAVDNMKSGTPDDHLHLRIAGHDAQCFSEAVGPSEIGEGYSASCLIERDGGFVTVSVFVAAPREDGVTTDGTVVTSRAMTVPDEAKIAARSLRDAIAQSVQFD